MRTFHVIGMVRNHRVHLRDFLQLSAADEKAREFDTAAIYRDTHLHSGRKFSDAHDKDYLVRHYDDPYWLSQGVKSTERRKDGPTGKA